MKTLTVAGSAVQVISVIRVITVITAQVTDPLYPVLSDQEFSSSVRCPVSGDVGSLLSYVHCQLLPVVRIKVSLRKSSGFIF